MKREFARKRLFFAFAVMALMGWLAAPVLADDTGFKSPTDYVSGTTGTFPDNPTGAFADDVTEGSTNDANTAKFRSAQPPNNNVFNPDTVMYRDFGFVIPAGSTIDGIEVVVSGYRGGNVSGAVFGVRLSGDAGTTLTAFKNTSALITLDALYTLGGASDLWSVTWDVSKFTNANFRVGVFPEGDKSSPITHTGRQWLLDSIKVKVYYTPPSACQSESETAWSDGDRYVEKGNWATYTPSVSGGLTKTLFAGQTMVAGTVDFSAENNGNITITITLNSGWSFQDVPENVKIQDYSSTPPAENPAPGLFDHKFTATSSPFQATVPVNNYYGVHVNVEHCQ